MRSMLIAATLSSLCVIPITYQITQGYRPTHEHGAGVTHGAETHA